MALQRPALSGTQVVSPTAGEFVTDVGGAYLDWVLDDVGEQDETLACAAKYPSVYRQLATDCGTALARSQLVELYRAGSWHLPKTRASYDRLIATTRTPQWNQYIEQQYGHVATLRRAIVKRLSYFNWLREQYDKDFKRLCLSFNAEFSGHIKDIEPLGDFHNGCCAVVLEDVKGARTVFKPRSSGPDAFYTGLVGLVEDKIRYGLRTARFLPTESGFWQEYIESGDPIERSQYLYQLGSWLALGYYTGLTDVHRDNVIDSADGPVLVDLECCFTPHVLAQHPSLESISAMTLGSVGILPSSFAFGEGADTVDWSVLAGDRGADSPSWASHLVRDDGLPTVRFVESHPAKAGPQERKQQHHAVTAPAMKNVEYEESFWDGFRDTTSAIAGVGVQTVMKHAVETLSDVRLVLRATQQYANCLRRSVYPNYMTTSVSRKQHIANWLNTTRLVPLPTTIRNAEADALAEFDIPAFYVSPASSLIDGLHVTSGFAIATKRLSRIGLVAERERSRRYIRQAFEAMRQGPVALSLMDTDRETGGMARSGLLLTQLAERMCQDGYRSESVIGWTNLQMNGVGRWQVAESDLGLYHGAAGMYLCLAALERCGMASERVRTAVETLEDMLCDAARRTEPSHRLGLFDGASGIIYALINGTKRGTQRVATRDYCDCILEGVEMLGHDVISGVSGVLLLTSAMARLRPEDHALAAVREACVARLRELAHTDSNGIVSWEDDEEWLGGLSHGTAGVTWACLRSADIEGATALARDAWRSQRSLLRSDGISWWSGADRSGEDIYAWCHGAEGLTIVLREKEDEAELYRKHRRALTEAPLPRKISLCHGLAGRAMVLDHLGLASSANRAYDLLWSHLSEFRERNDFLDDSLMLGTSGVILALLKSRFPDKVANPLTVEIKGPWRKK
ncbi:MAG: DUF4135 domain-containing protein [Actinomycetaceae bacterium]|nr:DUF4135 domain-containing protein [Actinomycetaceae bacterium]